MNVSGVSNCLGDIVSFETMSQSHCLIETLSRNVSETMTFC